MRALLAVAVIVVLVACGEAQPASPTEAERTPEPTPGRLTLSGTFTLFDDGGIRLARAGTGARVTACEGSGGYSDIRTGLGVVIRDQDGRTIGSSRLTHDGLEEVGDDDFCAFTFVVDVPSASFYGIEVGGRGELTYSHDELDAMNWTVTATLGQ